MNHNRWISLAGPAVVVVLAVAAITPMLGAGGADPPQPAGGTGATAERGEPIRVEVDRPQQRALVRTLRMPATLEAFESADLYAKTSGYVAAVAVDMGSRVRAGDVLLTIDVPEMSDELAQVEAELTARKAAVTQAEAQLATAKADVERRHAERLLQKLTFDRRRQLHQQNAIPQQELDEAQGRLDVADAEVRIAESVVSSRHADLAAAIAAVATARARVAHTRTLSEYATLRAPFDGVVTERFVHPGAFVRSAADGATSPLLALARTESLRLVLDIPESDARDIRIGTPAEVLVRAVMDTPLTATVARIAGALRPETRTLPVEIDLPNADNRFYPGMYAHVAVQLESTARAILIPSKAIRVRRSDLSVLVAEDGVAAARPIRLGYDDGIWAEILDGLAADDLVIVAASGSLAPGAPILATPRSALAQK